MSGHHISTDKTLLSVAGLLFVATLATVGVHYIEFPHPWSIIIALTIAVFKAGLVALFFMNLYWDKKFNGMLLIASFIFLALLVGFTMLDTLFRNVPSPSF